MPLSEQEAINYQNYYANTATAMPASPGANLFIALFTDDPTPDMTLNELVDTVDGYSRIAITLIPSTSANVETLENEFPLVWPAATGTNADDLTYFGIYDAVTAGNPIFYGMLSAPILWTSGASVAIAQGMLTLDIYKETSTCTFP